MITLRHPDTFPLPYQHHLPCSMEAVQCSVNEHFDLQPATGAVQLGTALLQVSVNMQFRGSVEPSIFQQINEVLLNAI